MITAILIARLLLSVACGTDTQEQPTDPQTGSTHSPQQGAIRDSTTIDAERQGRTPEPNELRLLQESTNRAWRLRQRSRHAFERGLMPLADYADQLDLALQIETAVAIRHENDFARDAALTAHADQLKTAAHLLRQFRQPGARGWRADVAHAEFLAADAALRATTNRQDIPGLELVSRSVHAQALRHFQLRLADFEQGLASLSDLSRAASHLASNISGQETSDSVVRDMSEYRVRLQQNLLATEELARLGAAGGRIDRIHAAQFELNRSTVLLAGLTNDRQSASYAFQAADNAAQQWLASQSRLHGSGTLRLFDLAQGWYRWQELHQQAHRFGLDVPKASSVQQQSDLQRLVRLSHRHTDVRGRTAADVSMVHSLEILTHLRDLNSDADDPESSVDR